MGNTTFFKSRYLLLLLIFNWFVLMEAQQFVGVSNKGGENASGAIFSWTQGEGVIKNEKFLTVKNPGSAPSRGVILANDGKLYGTTSSGGTCGDGTLFRYDPVTEVYESLVDFGFSNGSYPQGALFQATDGKIYGTTRGGGNNFGGIIFSFDPANDEYLVVHDFSALSGASPVSALIEPQAGFLFGHTSLGGSGGDGVLYKFDLGTNIYSVVVDFHVTDGKIPLGDLLDGGNGVIYGTTQGTNFQTGRGTIFSFDVATEVYTTLADFYPNQIGNAPRGSLVKDGDWIYGVLYEEFGNVPKVYGYNLVDEELVTKALFPMEMGGVSEAGGLVAVGNSFYGLAGWLYGNEGWLFRFDPSTSSIHVVMELDSVQLSTPVGIPLLMNGELMVLNANNGVGGVGSLFSINPTSTTASRLFDFSSPDPISNPYSTLTSVETSRPGIMYGIALNSRDSLGSLIYSYDHFSKAISPVANLFNPYQESFTELAGDKIYIIADSADYYSPAIISLNINTNSTKVEYALPDSLDQIGWRYTALIVGKNGKLYGAHPNRGIGNRGFIFSFDPVTQEFEVIAMCPTQYIGLYPWLLELESGNFLGAFDGNFMSSIDGVLFEYDVLADSFKIHHEFSTPAIRTPKNAPLELIPGKIWGIADWGGLEGRGGIYSFDLTTGSFVNEFDFTLASGSLPYGPIVENGLSFLGVLRSSGIYSFDTQTNAFTNEVSFSCEESGVLPIGITKIVNLGSTEPFQNYTIQVYPNPANTSVNLQFLDSPEPWITISLLSLDGRLIHRDSWYTAEEKNIPLVHVSPGLYVIRLTTDNFSHSEMIVVE